MAVFESIDVDGHEQVVFGFDPVSGLKTIIAIHSTSLGPALGGTRFFPYDSEADAIEDVLRLSKGMTYKSAAAGLDLGGGKAVIIGDPHTDKSERLFRAYGRFVDSLGGRYITAEDVGTTVDDLTMVARETRWAVGTPVAEGGSGDPSPVTARGLFAAARATAEHRFGDPDLTGRLFVVQGVGKVGTAFVRHLVEARAEVIVADAYEPAVDEIVESFGVKTVDPDDVFDLECDVFSPCALGAVLNEETIPRLRCSAVVGSANNQLATREDARRLAERDILYAPDFVINAGGLINVYDELLGYSKSRALHRVDGIYDATMRIFRTADAEDVTTAEAADRVARQRIDEIGDLKRIHRGATGRGSGWATT